MCGRYYLKTRTAPLAGAFAAAPAPGLPTLFDRHNICPTQEAPVVRRLPDAAGAPTRELALMRWGLVPSWADDPAIGSRMINARAETVARKPAFRRLLKARRCLVPASGFYEWQAPRPAAAAGPAEPRAGSRPPTAPAARQRARTHATGTSGRPKAKQPYLVDDPAAPLLAFAGLWDCWADAEGRPIETYTVLTCDAHESLRALHERMPVVLPPETWAPWLEAPADEALALLRPRGGLRLTPLPSPSRGPARPTTTLLPFADAADPAAPPTAPAAAGRARLLADLPASWQPLLAEQLLKPYFGVLEAFVQRERAAHCVYPPADAVFNSLRLTRLEQVKVVILGQDPYHGPGQAHGLAFSVPPAVPPPPSLGNIFRELHDDLGCPLPSHGCLESWARQGVLLLNAVLTVRAGEPNSHGGQGWETFTDAVLRRVAALPEAVVFLLWGACAQKKAALVEGPRHTILTAPHPSPLSANRGFLGCRHFSAANAALRRAGRREIDWRLPDPAQAAAQS